MTHSNHVKRALVLWALWFSLCAAGTGVAGAAQPASADPLRIIPADVLFCLRVNKLTTTLGQIDQFLTGVSPVGVSMPVRSQLGQFLGQPEPAGINMAGDVAVFWPLPGGEKPEPKRVGILIPLSDFQQFLANPNVAKPDGQGLVRIGPEGKTTLAGVQIGNYLLVTRTADQQALVEAKNWTTGTGAASLAQRLSPEELKRATGSPAWVYANVQVANKMFGPKLQEKIKEAQKHFQQMQAKDRSMPVPPEAMMEMWTSLLNSFLQQTQFVSLTLDPSASVVRLAPELAAVPNTEMAKILSLSGPAQQQANLMGYTRNGAITTGVANLNSELVRAITLKRVELAVTLMGQALSKEDLERFRKLALDSADAFGGSAAWAFLPDPKSKPPFDLQYVATLRDRQKFNDVLDQVSKLMSEGTLADLGKKFGLKMRFNLQRKASTYKDISIDAATIAIEPVDATSPQGQMIKAAYGEGLNLRLAVVNNLLLYTLSGDPEKGIRALIDQTKAGPGQIPSEVQAALQLIPEAKQADFFGTYNYLRAIQMAMAFMPMPMPPVELPSQSNAAFAGNVGNSRLLMNVAIPKQHVLELMSVVMKMQQQKMMEQQKQRGQQPTPPPQAQPQPGKPGQT